VLALMENAGMSTPGPSPRQPASESPVESSAETPVALSSMGRVARVALASLAYVSLASALPATRQSEAVGVGSRPIRISLLPGQGMPAGTGPYLPIAPEQAIVVNARRPFAGALEQAPSFRFESSTLEKERAVECLAAAAWYEAGDDPRGERAVIQVVLNRVMHPSYPKSVCGVVFEGSDRSTGCQFTFTCDGSLARLPREEAWGRARGLAEAALDGSVDGAVGAATHYHADYVVPYWSSRLDKLTQIGAHIFYRFPGNMGRKAVLRDDRRIAEPALPQLARFSPSHQASPDDISPVGPGAEGGLPSAGLLQPAAKGPVSGTASSAIMMTVDAGAAPGRWAVDALSRCRGREGCLVLGWGSPALMEMNRQRDPAQRDRPTFLFARDRSGMAIALWNCALVQRPDPSQCLPEDTRVLASLMRDRD